MNTIVEKFHGLKLTSRVLLVALALWVTILFYSVVSISRASISESSGSVVSDNSEPLSTQQLDSNQHIELRNFHDIELKIPAEIRWQAGDTNSCTVNKPLEDVVLKISADTLTIYSKRKYGWNNKLPKNIIFHCSSPEIKNITIEGAGEVHLSDVNTQELEVDINGAGKFTAMGSANNFIGEINGSGEMQLQELNIEYADLDINGMGKFNATQAQQVDIEINGMGSVKVSATTKVLSKEINGMGEVDIVQ